MRNRIFFSLLLALTTLVTHGQQREAAFAMNQRLGRGVNMGNCFEAPKETEWGNPWKPEYFRIMSELGFKHVRIPIRWEPADRSSATPPYTISSAFLGRIKQVVDTALKYKLHAILNMHHHEALFADPEGQKARFLAQWDQIARYFRDYPDSLLFEVLNEPNGTLTAQKWNIFFADALAEIRKTNPSRTVLMGVAEWGGLSAISTLQIPADENIILTIHYYNPFHFTHQGAGWSEGSAAWLGTLWQDTEAERETVRSEFRAAKVLSQQQHIPIHIGEFGAYSKADMASRVRWTTFLTRWFEEQGFSWAYWEFSAGFGIYNPLTKTIITPLAQALLQNSIPPATPVQVTPLYTSNFTSGNDGWSFYTQAGATGTLSRSGGKLIIAISNGGTEGYHAQLVRGNIKLVKGKNYQVTLKASAPANRGASVYIGKSVSDWGAYSSFNSFTFTPTEQDYLFTFTMSGENDNAARIVFDLGKTTTGITVASVKVEEVTVVTTSPLQKALISGIYPNPAREFLVIEQSGKGARAEILSLSGQTLEALELEQGKTTISIGHLRKGTYLVHILLGHHSEIHKLIIY